MSSGIIKNTGALRWIITENPSGGCKWTVWNFVADPDVGEETEEVYASGAADNEIRASLAILDSMAKILLKR